MERLAKDAQHLWVLDENKKSEKKFFLPSFSMEIFVLNFSISFIEDLHKQ